MVINRVAKYGNTNLLKKIDLQIYGILKITNNLKKSHNNLIH